ncbi:MAG: hypothetical protein ACFFFO_17480, partial [Candidatus Thorarchaeota archaeon]
MQIGCAEIGWFSSSKRVIEVKYTKPAIISVLAIIPLTILFGVTNSAGWVVLLFPVSAIIGTLLGFALA